MATAYNRVTDHAAWGRWHKVLRSLPGLSPLVSVHERVLREAQALAGSGRLEQGLALFKPFEENGQIPPWLYFGRLKEIYAAAGLWAKVAAMAERAARLAPDNPAVLIDAADACLRIGGDMAHARDLLDRAKTRPLTPISATYVSHAEGLLALQQSDPETAKDCFESALAAANELFVGKPMGRFKIDLIHADLAVAYARLGDKNQALEHFRRGERRLRARPWFDVLKQCKNALDNDLSSTQQE